VGEADTDENNVVDSGHIDGDVVGDAEGAEATKTHTEYGTAEAEADAQGDVRDAQIGAEALCSGEGADAVVDEWDDALVEEHDAELAVAVARMCDVESVGGLDK
jgi:hypothetical protein